MESALCLRYGPLPTLPLRIPSPVNAAARVTRPHFSFLHSSLSLCNTNRSIYRPLGHAFSPIVCAINRFSTPSTNDESDNKFVRGTIGASLLFACVLGIITCGCKMSPKASASFRKQPPTTVQDEKHHTYPLGGSIALKSLLEISVDHTSSRVKHKISKQRNTMLSKDDVDAIIKMEAIPLIRSGKGDKAVELLQKKYKQCEDDGSKFFVEMGLVELLIRLGKYEEAENRYCLKELSVQPSDARVPLYKAIIYTMLKEKKSAMIYWEKIVDAVEQEVLIDPDMK